MCNCSDLHKSVLNHMKTDRNVQLSDAFSVKQTMVDHLCGQSFTLTEKNLKINPVLTVLLFGI